MHHDTFWQRHTLDCPPALQCWLHDRGSLTRRIRQHCTQFSVQVVSQGLARVPHHEAALLRLPSRQLAHVRNVMLLADGKPVVVAHSVVAAHHLRGAWADIGKLGTRSLGTMLFTHPLVKRDMLHFKSLRPGHPLHQDTNPSSAQALWARRSMFYLRDAPLLVTETFLPSIMQLHISE